MSYTPCLARSGAYCAALLLGLLSAGCALSDVRLGEKLANEGKWDEAISAYRRATKEDPYDQELKNRLEQAKIRSAELHYSQGRIYLQENRITDALAEFKIALALDPTQREHQAAMGDALRLKHAREQLQAGHKLQSLGRNEDALVAFEQAVELDPNLTDALTGITTLTAQQQTTKALGGSSQPITLRFQNAKLKEVFEVLARSAGINVIFDKEIRDDPLTIFIKDMPFHDALSLILNTNSMLAQRVGPDTLLILPNNKQKQAQYQDLMIRTFYLSNAKAKDVVNLIRAMLESKRVYVDEKINAIVIRDEPAKLHLAERVINSIDRQDPEVELDVEILEVDRTKSLKYGLNFAKSAGAGIVPPGFTGALSTGATQFTFQELTSLGPNSYIFSFPASVVLDFFKQESDAKTLANPKIRVINNKAASITVGDKQPILLSTTNVLPGQAATGAVPTTSTVTSIEFKDVGVKLTVEPTVHLADELTLKLKVEVTRLGDKVVLQSSPEITQFKFGTRVAETVLMMKDDETVILAGLIQDEQRRTRVKVPWLDSIPIIGKLLASTTEDTVTTEVVLSITPHIVRRLNTPSSGAQAYWSGTESTYATTPLFSTSAIPVAHTGASRDFSVIPAPPRSTAPGGPAPLPPASQGSVTAPPPPGGGGAPPQPSAPAGVVARATTTFAIGPADLSARVGQEIGVQVSTDHVEGLTDSLVTITYDPNAFQFLRVSPGVATVGTSALPGRVDLSIHRSELTGEGNGVLARLFFRTKSTGDFQISLNRPMQPGQGAVDIQASGKEASVHVQ